MKINYFSLFLLLMSFLTYAQNSIKGKMEPYNETIEWAMLYQIQGDRQIYIQNSKIENERFAFQMPENSPAGMYRIVYRLEENGVLDVLYNNENVSFTFHPDFAEQTVAFDTSIENKKYQSYVLHVSAAQHYLDSLQVSYFSKADPVSEILYREAYYELRDIQKEYESTSKNMLAFHFIKATQRYNAAKIVKTPQEYLENIKENFFTHIDFNDAELTHSSFLMDRVIDYVFNLNYSQDPKIQEGLYKESIKKVLEIPKNETLQKEILEVIINEFVSLEEVAIVSYLFESYYDKLSIEVQTKNYKSETLSKMQVVVGLIAPDFSLNNGSSLLKLNTHKNYILVFWSTSCSHCTTQLPVMYDDLKNVDEIQVVAVALENEDTNWQHYVSKFKGWQHVLALGKWKNDIAKSYAIESTPTYFLLNANKRIIALPKNYKELKEAISMLK